uniref:Amidohydrolase n=1 Tax=Heterorhabditis bacteriophora TaxID=37862 RepID=A0A1I7XD60_HETBA
MVDDRHYHLPDQANWGEITPHQPTFGPTVCPNPALLAIDPWVARMDTFEQGVQSMVVNVCWFNVRMATTIIHKMKGCR